MINNNGDQQWSTTKINNGDDNDVNDDVKAMMVEALAEWIDGDVRMTRAEALFMYIAHIV